MVRFTRRLAISAIVVIAIAIGGTVTTSRHDPTPTNTPTNIATPTLSVPVTVVKDSIPAYNRREWRHWIDDDRDCQNARNEVLVAESNSPVTFKTERECQVLTGEWVTPFTNTTITNPRLLDIDHLVPLKNAHVSGGWEWDAERKRSYANNLTDPNHLIAVIAGANRSKGAKGPEEWRPPNKDYWCKYATDWMQIKKTWELTITPDENIALQEMLSTCKE